MHHCVVAKCAAFAFDARACQIAHLVIGECGPLHSAGVNLANVEFIADLTPPQRTVLVLLVDGQTDREVADHLGLSAHTVNDHRKAIYKHFDANSRAELLRRFMGGSFS